MAFEIYALSPTLELFIYTNPACLNSKILKMKINFMDGSRSSQSLPQKLCLVVNLLAFDLALFLYITITITNTNYECHYVHVQK